MRHKLIKDKSNEKLLLFELWNVQVKGQGLKRRKSAMPVSLLQMGNYIVPENSETLFSI